MDGGVILITSDHGNMEDLSVRRHTLNPVPALIFGPVELRAGFIQEITDLTHIAPAIWKTVTKM
jgi:bisphosphoglycerate-independent phosphoglycerate mutase (AlkP superfamily)